MKHLSEEGLRKLLPVYQSMGGGEYPKSWKEAIIIPKGSLGRMPVSQQTIGLLL